MIMRPRPYMPYWPAYPEPERSRIEAEYRAEEAKWQRECDWVMGAHCILIGSVLIGGGIGFAIFVNTAATAIVQLAR